MHKRILTLILCSFAFTLSTISAFANSNKENNQLNIIPAPASAIMGNGTFHLKESTSFYAKGKETKTVANFFASKLRKSTGLPLKVSSHKSKGAITLVLSKSIEGNETYELNVTNQDVTAKASTSQGLFYAMQTLMQLFPEEVEATNLQNSISWEAPAVTIKDKPRFSYRGIMLDVCRHFMPIEAIKRQIDVLSLFKINNLHLHLTEDQGWRVEIKKYPKLTSIGAWRDNGDGTRSGGYYTQKELKDLVSYAQQRFVNIVPELEIPGHELAAIASYPELSCFNTKITPRPIWGVEDIVMCPGKASTFQFLRDVIDELVEIFPSPYFHIGGDECPKKQWKECPLCQKLIKELGFKNEKGRSKEDQLQGYVVKRVEKYLNKKGKNIIGWDEILEGGNLNKSATIMSWRGEAGGINAALAGHGVIMSPNTYVYLDYYQGNSRIEPEAIGGYLPLAKTYSYNPISKKIAESGAEKFIRGLQGNVWTEYIPNEDIMEYRLFPRALAIAETGWSPQSKKNFDDFSRRLDESTSKRLKLHTVNFHIPLVEQKDGNINNIVFIKNYTLALTTSRPETIVYTTDGTEPTSQSKVYKEALNITKSTTIKTASLLPCGILGPSRTITLKKDIYNNSLGNDTKNLKNGLKMQRTNGTYYRTAELNKDKTWKTSYIKGTSDLRSQPGVGDIHHPNDYSAIADGKILIPEDAVYQFFTNLAEIWIDGNKIVVNKGIVKRHMRYNGSVALKAGLHQIHLIFLGNLGGGYPTYWDAGKVYYRTNKDNSMKEIKPEMLYY